MLISLLRLQAAAACISSRDPEDSRLLLYFGMTDNEEIPPPQSVIIPITSIPATIRLTTLAPITPPPICALCPLPIYRNRCNGETRSPCPTGTQANVQQRNAGDECIFTFQCPVGTQAFVWPSGRANPVAYSGTDLVCDRSSNYQWRTDMGLQIGSLSCMGPIPPVIMTCPACPTIAAIYEDCTMYGRTNCYTTPNMISATITVNGATCELDIICGPGTTLHFIAIVGPMNTGSPFGQLTCSATGGSWNNAIGIPVDALTCMSNT